MKKHEGRIFKCDYIDPHLLNVHTKEKHCEPGRSVKCSECEYECRSGGRMKRHLQAKHEINSFRCHSCDFVARSKILLVIHKTCVHSMFMFNLP